jgi:hypothetical protein
MISIETLRATKRFILENLLEQRVQDSAKPPHIYQTLTRKVNQADLTKTNGVYRKVTNQALENTTVE